MSTGRGIRNLFAPSGVVVGASRKLSEVGGALVRSLAGFAAVGHLALVNHRDDPMYGSLRQAARHGPVELVLICAPAKECPGVLVYPT
jgi:acetate---CoA ligase (ADP-forming)